MIKKLIGILGSGDRLRPALTLVIGLGTASALMGCGQKGPLSMPTSQAQTPPVVQSPPEVLPADRTKP